MYIRRAGHARPLYKRYKHSPHCAMVQPQYTVQEAQDCAMVQPQYELKHGPIGTRPVLAMLNHCTRRGTRTVHTVQYYTHSYEYKTGKMYISRAGHARPLYKRYKPSPHCAMVQL